MKKIFFLLMIFISLKSFAQHPIGNDSFQLQTLGSSNTLIKSKAAIGSDSGFVNAVYVDTAAANRGKIKNYPGAQIRVGDSIWVRNSTATGWINNTAGTGGLGGGSTNSNIGSGYRWAVPNTNNIKTAFPGYAILIDSTSNANALTIINDSATLALKFLRIVDTTNMLTPYVRGGSIAWPGTIYNTPTTATYSAHNLTYSPTLANQSPYTVFGRASGTGVPSFIAGIDSNWVTGLHTVNYYNTLYSPIWTLTTTGTSGAATYTGNVLNIPNYATGILSLSAIGAAPNANAATITGSVLNLEPASASFGGVVTTGTQTFAGDKTFTGHVAIGATASINSNQVVSIKETFTDGSNSTGLNNTPTFNFTADNANNFRGTTGAVTANLAGFNLTNVSSGLIGNQTTAVLNSTGTLTTALAYYARVDNTSTGTITNAYGIKVYNNVNNGGGTVTGSSGVFIQNQTAGTNNSNLVLGVTNTIPTGNYSIYSNSTYDSKFLGNVLMAARLQYGKGANIAAANNLTLGADGNVFTITGNTQINAITIANWQAGSMVRLIFSGTPTVKNNTAGGGGTAPFLLSGSVDFVAAANDILTIIYDGTNWHETTRKVAGTGSQLFWPLAGTGVGTGATNITYNTANWVTYDGTFTTTANNQWWQNDAPSITARGTASDVFISRKLSPTLVWGANAQTGAALYIDPTYTAGAFTTPQKTAIAENGDIYPITTNAWNLGKSGNVYGNMWATISNSNTFRAISGNISIQASGQLTSILINTGTAATRNTKISNNAAAADSLYMLNVIGEIKSTGGSVLVAQLPTPLITTVTNSGTTGATTYTYKIVFRDIAGNTTEASAAVSTTTGNATLTSGNFNTISWGNTEATSQNSYYVDVYRTVGGGSQGKIGTITGYNSGSFNDNNLSTTGDGTTAPADNTTGNIGAGILRPLAAIHLRAGVAAAGGAAMFLTSGVAVQTTQIAGQVNYNGTDIFLTNGTSNFKIDKSLTGSGTLNFPSTLAVTSSDLTITVTGAADGDVVSLGVPNGSVNANSCYTAWVSAANTVTVRFNNYQTVGAIDPASGTFKVRVIQ